jgi:hypothetical protein
MPITRYNRDPRGGNGPRVVIRHVYKGVTFYSADGREMSQRQQQVIVQAAQKVPPQVWQSLAAVGARVIVMNWDDTGVHPRLMELTGGNQSWDLLAEPMGWQARDISMIGELNGRKFPVAVVGLGPKDKDERRYVKELASGEMANLSGITRAGAMTHEVAHLVDFSNRLMRSVGKMYMGLHGDELKQAIIKRNPMKPSPIERYGGLDVGWPQAPMDISTSKSWKQTHPKNYTAQYGGLPPLWGPKNTRAIPETEVFAEALSRHWLGQSLPLKVKGFFDDYFSPQKGLKW